MKRYAYPLVILAIITCIALQAAWLTQLFRAQQMQVKRELEQATANAAKISNYLSLVPGHEKSENFRDFFLSREWLQFAQAYTNMRYNNVGSRFEPRINGDTTIINIALYISNKAPDLKNRKITRTYDEGESFASEIANDDKDFGLLDSIVNTELTKSQLNVLHFKVRYNYDNGLPLKPYTVKDVNKAGFHSEHYGYNLRMIYTFQLLVPSVTNLVLYRMRYYLISSIFMLLLTMLAFYFVFRLLRSQRLYSQARQAFTSNMTHELKTPVAVMDAALDAITRYQLTNNPEKLEKYINISKTELHRLNIMIEKVLNLEELDNGDMQIHPELYDVQQGLEQVVTSMQLQKNAITYHPSQEPCFLDGDPVHLTNVFYNLIDNAIKYGGPAVRVDIHCICQEDKIRISIKDDGPGIDSLYHKRIFERFFRIHENINVHNVKGSGIGLYYVKQIIGKHGGSIRLISEQGKGAEFIIELPVYNEI